jgi:hypothetical protein
MTRTAAALDCEQVVVPVAAGALSPIAWSYFDPQQSRYHTLRQMLPEVAVPLPRDAAATAVSAAVSTSTQASPESSGSNLPYWLAAFVLAGTAAVGVTVWRKRRHIHADAPPAAHKVFEQHLAMADQALAGGCVDIFYTILFVILQHLVGAFSKLPATAISGMSISFPPLNTCEKQIGTLLSRCDEIRYGRRKASKNDMEYDLTQLHALLEKLPSL